MQCNICQTELGAPIYEAPSDQALTSLCELRLGRVKIWLCPKCGHLRGEPLPDTQSYYESDYRILLDHEDEDQIYEVQGERIVYRTDHQVATLLTKLDLPFGAQLLDYGCAKAATPRRLLTSRPDLQVSLFDVSAMYTRHWQLFLPQERWAIYDTPPEWQNHYDVITSFFALEHIPDPLDTVRRVADLLAEHGVFYGIVPDVFGNVADFVVIDHVNHFTNSSLHALLRRAGFNDIQIDSSSHRGALVFVARKFGQTSPPTSLGSNLSTCNQLASYWGGLSDRIRAAETTHPELPAAIYGSGFYGAYISSLLRKPERVECFLDANPFRQGKQLFGHTILPPDELPNHIRLLYIGLNPKIARTTIDSMNWLHRSDLQLVFLDEDSHC
jgi:SAM-dependent methyltransferase